MPNTRELRRRIKSIRNTAQITKAMQMVAATKMRKAQTQALSGRPYSDVLNDSLTRLLPNVGTDMHPLLKKGAGPTSAVVILSTDKPLCGALNTNIFRAIIQFKDFTSPTFYTMGGKGRNFVARTGKKLEADFENPETVSFRTTRQLGKLLIESFLRGNLKEVYLAYPHFVSTLRQEAKIVKLIPIGPEIMTDKDLTRPGGVPTDSNFLFEPNPALILDEVLNHYVEIQIYQAMLETKASEHSARMIAMQNATDNALGLVDDLTLNYNQIRQDAITREILEIASATAAME